MLTKASLLLFLIVCNKNTLEKLYLEFFFTKKLICKVILLSLNNLKTDVPGY